MDNRLYFVLGDLLANVVSGAVIGVLVYLLTPQGWNMWLVMLAAMFVGMLLAAVCFMPFSYFFGAMEVMAPLMLTGMAAGMVVGMHAAMRDIGGGMALFEGAVCGLACIVAVWIINNSLRGPQRLPGGERREHG